MSNSNDGSGYNLSARILTTSILSLIFIVLLLIVLHLYARCVLRRSGSTATRTVSLFRIASDGAQIEPRSITGLDQSTIELLPTFPYKKDDDSAECSICLSLVRDEEMVRVLPNCKHLFHVECVDMWLHSHSTCPLCRAKADAGVEPNGSGLVSRLGSSLRRMMSRERSEDLEWQNS